jgi:uncharacterized membrane protein HdeD (DUF308 family)
MHILSSHYPSNQARESTTWSVALGALFILTGVTAIAAPVATSVGLAYLLGALFLICGLAQLVYAVRLFRQDKNIWRFLMSALLIVSGAITLRNPIIGTAGITLTLTFYLFMSAFTRWMISDTLRPHKGWIPLFLGSVISFGLGVYLIVTFPVNSLIVPGIFFGVDMVFFGTTLLTLEFSMRRMQRIEQTEIEHERHAA